MPFRGTPRNVFPPPKHLRLQCRRADLRRQTDPAAAGTSVRPTILFASVPNLSRRPGNISLRHAAAHLLRGSRPHGPAAAIARSSLAAYTDRSRRRIGLFPSALAAPGRGLLLGRLPGRSCCLCDDLGRHRRRRPVGAAFLLADVYNVAQLSRHGDVTTVAVSITTIRAPVEDVPE